MPGKAAVFQSDFGPMLAPPCDEYISKSIAVYGAHSKAEWEAWQPYIRMDSVVLDIGANVGSHTLWFASRAAEVYAFEPQPFLYHCLCGSLALCGVENVVAMNTALGDSEGQATMPVFDYSRPNNFGGLSMGFSSAQSVPLAPIDALGLPHPSFVKIDVEGMEMEVLKGGEKTLKDCPVIVAECQPGNDDNVGTLMEWFNGHGYDVYFQETMLGDLWQGIASHNLMAVKGVAAPELPRV